MGSPGRVDARIYACDLCARGCDREESQERGTLAQIEIHRGETRCRRPATTISNNRKARRRVPRPSVFVVADMAGTRTQRGLSDRHGSSTSLLPTATARTTTLIGPEAHRHPRILLSHAIQRHRSRSCYDQSPVFEARLAVKKCFRLPVCFTCHSSQCRQRDARGRARYRYQRSVRGSGRRGA
ncbi:hypothetical protein TFLX_04407 [Thermoflexales bacterium]|nr:hypothetical protein TFLX_04407 [Thermoflexales bacterium]